MHAKTLLVRMLAALAGDKVVCRADNHKIRAGRGSDARFAVGSTRFNKQSQRWLESVFEPARKSLGSERIQEHRSDL